MGLSDGIAILALIVAGVSAWYSYKTVATSKKANKLSVQFERVKIYRHLLDYQKCFWGLFANPTLEKVHLFRDEAVVLSEIYFSDDIHNDMLDIFSESDDWAMRISAFEGVENPDNAEIHEMKRDFANAVTQKITDLIPKIKEDLKVDV